MAVTEDQANSVFLGLLRVQKLLVAAKHSAPRLEDGVDVTAYPVLFVVAGAGTVRISELATTLHNDASTVSRQVSSLVSDRSCSRRAPTRATDAPGSSP